MAWMELLGRCSAPARSPFLSESPARGVCRKRSVLPAADSRVWTLLSFLVCLSVSGGRTLWSKNKVRVTISSVRSAHPSPWTWRRCEEAHRILNSVRRDAMWRQGGSKQETRGTDQDNEASADEAWAVSATSHRLALRSPKGEHAQRSTAHFCSIALAAAGSACAEKRASPAAGLRSGVISLRVYYFCKVLMFLAYGLPWRMLVNSVSLLPRDKEPQWPTVITALMWGLCFGPA